MLKYGEIFVHDRELCYKEIIENYIVMKKCI